MTRSFEALWYRLWEEERARKEALAFMQTRCLDCRERQRQMDKVRRGIYCDICNEKRRPER